MTASTKVNVLTSDTFDANVRNKLNEEPFLIYKGQLDSITAGAHVEHTFMIPAGYAVKKVVSKNTTATGNSTDKIGVGTTTGTGVDIVAAVISANTVTDHTVAIPATFATDRLGYIHTMTNTSYDICADYTITLMRVFYPFA